MTPVQNVYISQSRLLFRKMKFRRIKGRFFRRKNQKSLALGDDIHEIPDAGTIVSDDTVTESGRGAFPCNGSADAVSDQENRFICGPYVSDTGCDFL